MEADGQLLWKPQAGHESHLAKFGRIVEGGGHDGDCLREQRAQLPGRLLRWAGQTPSLR
ncbi:uncharacterized protein V6R79_007032 [Siganus canaliculatus]